MKYLEIKFWRFAQWLIRRDYRGDCKTSDIDDGVIGKKFTQKAVMSDARCPSCRAKETINFIEDHIDLIRFMG